MPGVPELSPTEFVERWPNYAGGGDVVLLDVREHVELELAAVAGAVHIPMREVPARLAELDATKPLVVMCHSGGRSRRVAEYLAANGFSSVLNLKGGIDAWSTQLDSHVPRY
jgi:sulfur-carrier protein adenylyltransferase/sulfurtransferase